MSASTERTDYGFGALERPELVREHEILLCEIGSTAHGCGVDNQDDLDLMGIFIEPPEYVCGLRFKDHWVAGTSEQHERSGPGDVDAVYYSLRKFARLAAAGNPSILNMFFAPVIAQDELGHLLRTFRSAFVSKAAAPRYLGYMKQQKERLMGIRGQKRVKRPELDEAYGFDTKYAYHIIRLAIQGAELMRTGSISMPMSDEHRTYLRGIRTGSHTLQEALAAIGAAEQDLKDAVAESKLPDEPDRDLIDATLTELHRLHWGWNRD